MIEQILILKADNGWVVQTKFHQEASLFDSITGHSAHKNKMEVALSTGALLNIVEKLASMETEKVGVE